MPQYYSPEVVKQVQQLLDTPPSEVPITTTWKRIVQIFTLKNIIRGKRQLRCRQLLPHPKNRGGIMLNGFNCRATGSKVARVGANVDELHGAVCIEISPFANQAKQQYEANFKLAAQSKGLLPAPEGDEQFLTLGTSHMCAFIRCAET